MQKFRYLQYAMSSTEILLVFEMLCNYHYLNQRSRDDRVCLMNRTALATISAQADKYMLFSKTLPES